MGKILKNPLQKHWKIPKNSFTKIKNLKGKKGQNSFESCYQNFAFRAQESLSTP